VNGGRGAALLATFVLLTALPVRAHAGPTSAQLAERLQGRGIRSARVLDAFRRVHREAFVPATARDRAYEDIALGIGHGQTMSQPYVLALMAEQLGLTGNERVLEIGTGSGYDTAVLATLAHDVYSVEIVPDLAVAARLALAREAYLNVHVKQGDGTLGWREYGPYDAIMVTAAAPAVPRALVDQLKDGGVLVMPVGDRAGRQVLLRGVKRGGKLHGREVAEVKLVPPLTVGRGSAQRAEEPARALPPRAEEPMRIPAEAPALREEHPARDLNEEDLPERDDSGPESDRRPLRAGRIRVARARDARGSDRRSAAGAPAFADAGSPAIARRFAA